MTEIVLLTRAWAGPVLLWAVEATAVAFVLALIVAAVSRRYGSRLSPATRHLLWLVVLAKMMLPPVVSWPWSITIATQARAMSSKIHDEVLNVEADSAATAARERATASLLLAIANWPVDDLRELTALSASEPELNTANAAAPIPRVAAANQPALLDGLFGLLIIAWCLSALVHALRIVCWIVRFQRRLRGARSAPAWLRSQADDIALEFDVRLPEIRIVGGSGTPQLWCFGQPIMVVPGRLLTTLPATRWRAILAHELAHLKRNDHWVSRAQLIAGLVWSWNPLYWWVVRRMGAEAELACDAWVVEHLPRERAGYAESLVQICTFLNRSVLGAPALGITGTGRFIERRLTMILHERVANRRERIAVLMAALFALLALPGWLSAKVIAARAETEFVSNADLGSANIDDPDDDEDDDADDEDDTDDEDADDDEDDDEDDADDDDDDDDAEAKIKQKLEKALGPDFEKRMEAMGERIAKQMEAKFGAGSDFEKKMEAFGKEMELKFGPEFEKKMEAKFGKGSDFEKKMEAFGKKMESKFGPEFEKKMEAFGRDFEERFGGDFAKNMEAFGKEMEEGFGKDFAKKMEAFGKEMEESFGPEFQKQMKDLGEELSKELGEGSDFAKEMEGIREKVGEELSQELGPGSEFEKEMKAVREKIKSTRAKARDRKVVVDPTDDEDAEVKKARAERDKVVSKAKAAGARARAQRVEQIEARLKALSEELERLKSLDSDDEDEEEEENED